MTAQRTTNPPRVPHIGEFQQQISGPDDPRFSPIMRHLQHNAKLGERVEEIFRSTGVRTGKGGSIDAGDIEKAASRGRVTEIKLQNAKLEMEEVNGHLVYYLQPTVPTDPQTIVDKVIAPALGAVWDTFGVQGWAEVEPNSYLGIDHWVWGIQIRNLTLNGMNRGMFSRVIPQAFDRLLGAQRPQ